MSAADILLQRLARVRSRGVGQWVASCPGPLHERGDRSAGLGIRQVDDLVLINCPAGCTAAEIVAAVGLSLADLFERPLTTSAIAPVRQPPFPAQMAQRLLHFATVLMLAAEDLRHGKRLSSADHQTVRTAYEELEALVMSAATWPKGVRA